MKNISDNKKIVEALLFVSGEPVKFSKLEKKINIPKEELKKIVGEIANEYKDRGVNILEIDDVVEMVTSPDVASHLSEFIKADIQEDLSSAALETLSVIAYRGPVSRVQIEDIRGVNCTFILRNLLIRGLVKRSSRADSVRSFVYSVTADFLKKLGIKKIEDLPEYGQYNTEGVEA